MGLRNMYRMPGRLFDTNVLLWFRSADARLPADIRKSLEDPGIKKYISIASAWEVAIKISVGKLKIEGGSGSFWHAFLASGFEFLPISIETVRIVETLPFHHKDPFDRILIASAMEHGLEIVATDEDFAKYRP